MRETSLRGKFRDFIEGLPGHVTNHEDKFMRGVFDCSYVFLDDGTPRHGWVEFKHLPVLPRRETTPLDLGISKEQVLWGEDRLKYGDTMFVMIRVVNIIYLFPANRIRELYGRVSLVRLEQIWIGRWERSFNNTELKDCLCGR